MSSTYAGVPVYHAQSVLPGDGDPAIAESVDVCLRALLDSTAYLNAQMTLRVDFLSPGLRGYNQDSSAQVSIDGTGTIILNTNVQIGGGGGGGPKALTVISPTTFSSSSTLAVRSSSSALVSPLTTIGSGPTQALTVNSTSEFDGPVQVDGTLTVNGVAAFTNHTQLGQSNADVISVLGRMDVDPSAVFHNNVGVSGNLAVSGSTSLGNASSDSFEVSGEAQFNDPVHLQSDLHVDGAAAVDGDLDVDGSVQLGNNNTSDIIEVHGTFRTFGKTTLGDSSSDDLFVNALLASPLGFTGDGRIPFNLGGIGNSAEITPSSGNFIVYSPSTSGQTYTVSSDFAPGDFFFLFRSTGTVTLQLSGSAIALNADTPFILCVKRTSGQSWSYVRWSATSDGGIDTGTTSA